MVQQPTPLPQEKKQALKKVVETPKTELKSIEPAAPPADVERAHPPATETRAEQKMKEQPAALNETMESVRHTLTRQKTKKQTKIPQVRDELTVKVEKIMEEGLKDAFKELDTVGRQEFKIKGEETAIQIRQLMKGAHVKLKKIFRLLFDWLKLLPGINRFYLEQEAKIKADKILSLKERE